MLNQLILVGRIVKGPNIEELEDGKKVSNFTLAVQRPYKNKNGEYDSDFIECSAWNNVANTVHQYMKKGDLMGVRGRLSSWNNDGEKKFEVVAEKITFLSTQKNIDRDEEYEEPNISL